jgi:hypothetical protein
MRYIFPWARINNFFDFRKCFRPTRQTARPGWPSSPLRPHRLAGDLDVLMAPGELIAWPGLNIIGMNAAAPSPASLRRSVVHPAA